MHTLICDTITNNKKIIGRLTGLKIKRVLNHIMLYGVTPDLLAISKCNKTIVIELCLNPSVNFYDAYKLLKAACVSDAEILIVLGLDFSKVEKFFRSLNMGYKILLVKINDSFLKKLKKATAEETYLKEYYARLDIDLSDAFCPVSYLRGDKYSASELLDLLDNRLICYGTNEASKSLKLLTIRHINYRLGQLTNKEEIAFIEQYKKITVPINDHNNFYHKLILRLRAEIPFFPLFSKEKCLVDRKFLSYGLGREHLYIRFAKNKSNYVTTLNYTFEDTAVIKSIINKISSQLGEPLYLINQQIILSIPSNKVSA